MLQVQDEFNIRYYLWALQDVQREIAEGFPYLKYFKSDSPYWVVKMMSEMSHDEQLFFGRALVKRFHLKAIRLTGDAITEDEQYLCDKYRAIALGLSPTELKIRGEQLSGKKLVFDKKSLTKSIKTAFQNRNSIHLAGEFGGMGSLTTIGRWTIRTRIETKLRFASLRYSHQIYSSNAIDSALTNTPEALRSSLVLTKLVSLNSWLGISSETAWCDLTDSEFSTTSQQLATLCAHFLSAASKLPGDL